MFKFLWRFVVFCGRKKFFFNLESVTSLTSLSIKSKENGSAVNEDFLEFIYSKSDFMKVLVIQVEATLEIQNYFERLLAFMLCGQNQMTELKNNTKEEQVLLMKTVGENIGGSLEEYITHIQNHILVEEPVYEV